MNKSTINRTVRRAALAAAVVAVMGLLAVDRSVAQSAPAPATASAVKAPAKVTRVVRAGPRVQVLPSGMTVTIDPVTKRIRPATPEELQVVLAAQAARAALGNDEILLFEYADGMKSARLPDSFLETAVATRRPDGKIVFECLSDRERQERAALATRVTVPAAQPTTAVLEER
jgi:hypothetical protein